MVGKVHRIMLKEHKNVPVKYLCYSARDDYEKYRGSGFLWIKILQSAGWNYTTKVLFESDNKKACGNFGRQYSIENDIVASSEYANLIKETCGGGIPSYARKSMLGKHHSEASKKKMSMARMGNKCKLGKLESSTTKAKKSDSMKGKPKSLEHRRNISLCNRRRPMERLIKILNEVSFNE